VGLRAGAARRSLVLCYHAVSDTWEHSLSVRPVAFERQLRFLVRLYRAVPAAEIVHARGRLLHVTFDDAFRSVDAALPTLERLGVPATVFACTDLADEGLPLAVPELAAETAAHPEELSTHAWERLRELADRGVEIGSHTCSHPHLPRVGDDELDRELRESRTRLEDELQRPCRFLAYPFGDEDGRVRAAARRAGYEAAFALPGDVAAPDDFALPRLGVWRRDTLPRLALKLGLAEGRRPAWLPETLR
jgi:peptidoglycan/xylan/chitin deacetylase (PgdA/CDA1 family)